LTLRQNFPPRRVASRKSWPTLELFIETRFTRSSEGRAEGVRPGDL
jgi:hypothetical protein